MRRDRLLRIGVAVLLALGAAGCGGGGGSGGGLTPPPSSNVSVTISPASSTVGYGGTQQFTASVAGSTNTTVTWSVSSATSSSSSQIGSINSSGVYTAPAATSAPPETTAQPVTVTAGNTAQNINVSVPALNSIDSVTVTATSQADTSKSASATVTLSGLSIMAMGQCDPNTNKCTGSATGTAVTQGQTATLFVAGYGILPGTTYAISGADVVVTQPPDSNFKLTNNGTPGVYFQVSVLPGATLGPRNLVVRNQGNELASFPGGLLIKQ